MKDSSVPSIVINTEQKIDISIQDTQTKVADQGYTYNQVGFTYNQAGWMYGGAYGLDAEVIPTISLAEQITPSAIAERTQAQIADQGYTYNQPGFTYNQPGWMYGGLYNQNFDLSPEFVDDTAYLISPSISAIIDIGKQGGTIPPITNGETLIGILGLLYP